MPFTAMATPPVTPSNVLYYIPINVMNQQSIAVSANTPIAIGSYGYYGNVIGFNALKYSQYYTCNLDNAEFFFANGTIATSWLEGNIMNAETANSACTGASSPNALVDSSNILYWVNIPGNYFLPANTGTPSYNTIYLGWTGNTLTAANNLFSSKVGEAPQLSSSYGQYDNGANVFTAYWNNDTISTSKMPTSWVGSVTGFAEYNTPITTNIVWETYAQTPSTGFNTLGGGGIDLISLFGSGALSLTWLSMGSEYSGVFKIAENSGAGAEISNYNTNWDVFGIAPTTSYLGGYWQENYAINYTSSVTGRDVWNTPGNTIYVGQDSLSTFQTIGWTRVRNMPPDDVLPNTTYGAVAQPYTGLVYYSSNAANDIDVGNSNTISVTVQRGTGSYYANVVYSSSNVAVSNTVLVPVNGIFNIAIHPSAPNSMVITVDNTPYDISSVSTIYGNWNFNVLIVDSGQNSISFNVPQIMINPQLIFEDANPAIIKYTGQYGEVNYSATASGGVPPYTYTFSVYNSTNVPIKIVHTTSQTTNSFSMNNFQLGLLSYGFYNINITLADSSNALKITKTSKLVFHPTSCIGIAPPAFPAQRNATFDVQVTQPGVTITQETFPSIGTAVLGYPTDGWYNKTANKISFLYSGITNGDYQATFANPNGTDMQIVPYLYEAPDENPDTELGYMISSGTYSNGGGSGLGGFNVISLSASSNVIYGVNLTKSGLCTVRQIINESSKSTPHVSSSSSPELSYLIQSITVSNMLVPHNVTIVRYTLGGDLLPNVTIPSVLYNGNYTSSFHGGGVAGTNVVSYLWNKPNQTNGFGNSILYNVESNTEVQAGSDHSASPPNGTQMLQDNAGDFLTELGIYRTHYANGTLLQPVYTHSTNLNEPNLLTSSIYNPNSVILGGLNRTEIANNANYYAIFYPAWYNLGYAYDYGFSYCRWDEQSITGALCGNVEPPGDSVFVSFNGSKQFKYLFTKNAQGLMWGTSDGFAGNENHVLYTSDESGEDEIYLANVTYAMMSGNWSCPNAVITCGVFMLGKKISTGQSALVTVNNTANGIAPYNVIVTITGPNTTATNIDIPYGKFIGTNSYPIGIYNQSCVAYSSQIFCIGGETSPGNPTDAVYYANISTSGIGPWRSTTPYPTSISNEQCFPFLSSITCIGGNTGSGPTNAVYVANIIPYSKGQGLKGWNATAPYPTKIEGQSCAIAWAYGVFFFGAYSTIDCIGGYNGTSTTNAFYYSSINQGYLNGWSANSSDNYPVAVAGISCASDFKQTIYCIGGGGKIMVTQ